MSDDPKVAALATAVERAIAAALAPVVARLRALETAAARLTDVPDLIAALRAVSAVPGPPGPPGPPGAAGAGAELVACDYDGERTVTLTWTRGGATEQKAIVLPVQINRGAHVPGRLYERGDCVTVDGSIFHCNADTTARPGSGATAWTLVVKHGRDLR